MGNMSYCRFRNTVLDLRDCLDNLKSNLSVEHDREEFDARAELIEVCRELVEVAEETDFDTVYCEDCGEEITDEENEKYDGHCKICSQEEEE